VAKKSSGGTPATVALTKAGVAFTVHPYDHSEGVTNFGEEAAAALGVERGRIFKTLVVDVGGELVVAVVPVARQLDLKALAGAAGAKKAVMAEPAAAARSSGYVVGGISPLGQRTRLRTFVDRSAEEFPTIFVSAGKRGLQVELAVGDLIRITGGQLSSLAARRESAPPIED
jgi:Cys-tRNA(Pro)/Cys-tRNA(Cys) deacylase